jgi:hypothetical protein
MNNFRTVNKTTLWCLSLLCLMISSATAFAQTGKSSSEEKSAYLEKARGYGQCEIFLMKGQPGKYAAQVYNTTPLNDCPPSKFDPIDPKVLAKNSQSDLAWKNPRRYWMMDHLTVALVGEPREFDGLKFNFVASMQMPPNFKPGEGQAGFAFQPTQIRRVTKYEYLKGNPVFLLLSPDGHTWVMQTYTTHTDRTLTQADLPNLSSRLKLPAGWQFKVKTLDRDLIINTTGLAHIVPDNLENMYQGCFDTVCNFIP